MDPKSGQGQPQVSAASKWSSIMQSAKGHPAATEKPASNTSKWAQLYSSSSSKILNKIETSVSNLDRDPAERRDKP